MTAKIDCIDYYSSAEVNCSDILEDIATERGYEVVIAEFAVLATSSFLFV